MTIDSPHYMKSMGPGTPDTVRALPDYHRNNSAERLVDGQRPKKRRRVQDIFKTQQEFDRSTEHFNCSEVYNNTPRYRECPTDNACSLEHYSREPRRFGHAHGLTTQNTPGSDERRDSMYGYVPKTMKNVYASTVLEGEKIDDFFGNCRTDSWMNMFASADKVRPEQGTVDTSVETSEANYISSSNGQGQENTKTLSANITKDSNLIDFNTIRGQTRSENDMREPPSTIFQGNYKSRHPPTGYLADLFHTPASSPSVLVDSIEESGHTLTTIGVNSVQRSQKTDFQEEMQCNSSWNAGDTANSRTPTSKRQFEKLVRSGDVLY